MLRIHQRTNKYQMQQAADVLRDALHSDGVLYSSRARPLLVRTQEREDVNLTRGLQHCPWIARRQLHADMVLIVVVLALFAVVVCPPVQWIIQSMFKHRVHVKTPTGGFTVAGYFINVVLYAALVIVAWAALRIVTSRMRAKCHRSDGTLRDEGEDTGHASEGR